VGNRWRIAIVAVAVIGLLLAINTLTVDQQTKPASVGEGTLVDLPGGSIHLQESGRRSAPPVVLIHGWTGSTNWWADAAEILARRYRVIRVDLLGHGRSEKPAEGYTMEDQAVRAARAVAALGVRRAMVAGHSTGGEVAIALAARYPQLTRALVVVDTEANADQVDTSFTTKLSTWPVAGQLIWRFATDGQIRNGLEQAFAPGFDVPDVFVDDVRRMTYTSYSDTHRYSADFVEDGTQSRAYRRVRAPAMVVFGSEDELVDPAAAEDFAKLRRTRVEIVEGAGHSPMVEKPPEVARLMTDFDPAAR
jgi:pimeloyl-ACP methyl ester carboxylesterase